MITLRFEAHNSGNYEVFPCARYSVADIEGDTSDSCLREVRMHRTPDDDNPYYQTVGDHEFYGICYVMNDAGKTIDTIR